MITPEIMEEVLRLKSEKPRITFRQIAEQLLGDANYAGALRKYIADSQRGSEISMMKTERRKIIPQPYMPYLGDILSLPPQYVMDLPPAPTVNAKDAIILGDLHCPHVDRALIEAIMLDSRVNNIDTLIIAGDIIDGQFTGRHKNPPEFTAPAMDELGYMRHYLRYFEKMFTDVYILPGNHDGWVTDYFEMSLGELVGAMLGEHDIQISDYGYIFLNDNVVVGHLEEWNAVPGFLAWKIAQQFNRHAIVNHDHIRGVYTENTSKFYGVSVGASLVPENIYYKKASFNSFPAIQCGYAVVQNENTLRLMNWDGVNATVDKVIHLGD